VGQYLRLEPGKVYVHSGTRVGAKRLGLNWRNDMLEMSDLPAELQVLSAAEVEDFLCVCEHEIKRLGCASGGRSR
jgi:hypothetical protein